MAHRWLKVVVVVVVVALSTAAGFLVGWLASKPALTADTTDTADTVGVVSEKGVPAPWAQPTPAPAPDGWELTTSDTAVFWRCVGEDADGDGVGDDKEFGVTPNSISCHEIDRYGRSLPVFDDPYPDDFVVIRVVEGGCAPVQEPAEPGPTPKGDTPPEG